MAQDDSHGPPDAGEGFWRQMLPKPEVRIVTIYLVLASLWVVGSDIVIDGLVESERARAILHPLKGLKFVLTTGVLLYFVLRRAYRGWRLAERERAAVLERARTLFRELSAHVQTLREEDRIRISRELHDELGQSLTALKLELRWIEDHLNERDDRALNPMIDRLVEAQELVDATADSVRRISADLRPDSLDKLGLKAALEEEAAKFSGRAGIPCDLDIGQIPDPLPPSVAIAAFRIFQEALTNVTRHAEAKAVRAECSVEDGGLKLNVSDDGKGLDSDLLDDPKSLGLLGMRERAEMLGGRVAFAREVTGGTRVSALLPIPPVPAL